MKTQSRPTLVWNSKTKEFNLCDYSLASACLHVGSVEGFNRLRATPIEATTIRVKPLGKKTCVELTAYGETLWRNSGRVEAKRIARQLHALYGGKLVNVKASGKEVEFA